jgi:pyrroloquinoline-quinone synthase
MDFWTRLELLRTECDVLKHPFYERWSAGELSRPELARYAGEYRHAVVALAAASRGAADTVDAAQEPALADALREHAREEESHVGLWDDFMGALDANRPCQPNPETLACAEVWAGQPERPLLDSLVTLYTIESAQPAISATKRAGLATHYALGAGAGTAYFELHERLDLEHAAHAKAIICARLSDGQEERLLSQAASVLSANWQLLDGVERVSRALVVSS